MKEICLCLKQCAMVLGVLAAVLSVNTVMPDLAAG